MNFKRLLTIFDLRPIEINVYQKVFYYGPVGASEIARQAGISRASVYDIIEKLIGIGLVAEGQSGGIKTFSVQSPQKIKLLFEERQQEILSAKQELDQASQIYFNNQKFQAPKLQIFQGQKELQQMMKDILLYDDITLRAYWSIEKVVEILGRDFFSNFQNKRIKQNINLKVIWPQKQVPSFKKYPVLAPRPELKRQARIAPKNIDFSAGYAIYGNTVRFISSTKGSYGFLVESPELADTMKTQFDMIWDISKLIGKSKNKTT